MSTNWKSSFEKMSASDRKKAATLVALIVVIFFMAVQLLAPSPAEPTPVTLSRALEHVADGEVKYAVVVDGAGTLELKLEDDVRTNKMDEKTQADSKKTTEPKDHKVVAVYPMAYAEQLTKDLVDGDVPISTNPVVPGGFGRLVMGLLPVFLIFLLILWMSRGGLSGGMSKMRGGRGDAIGTVPEARFSDVAGCDEAIAELTELVQFLRDDSKFTAVGAKAPRGALLVGPPGTGKTLLARAVAGEAGVPFFALAGSDFVETYAGVGARRVRDLFDKARKAGNAIIFIDEIDAVGRSRGSAGGTGSDREQENTLISMLAEMDGFDTGHRIIVLAATNRADVLDAALIRPGRLDRQVQVPAPDRLGREKVLEVHCKAKPISERVDLTALARRTPGMAGAELAQLVNEACMEAARAKSDVVTPAHFDSALATVALGRARTSALVTDRDREITAWHEAGHTLAALLQKHADNPVQVSIVPRGGAGGVTWMSGNDDVYLSRLTALAQLRTSLGGRAAEEMLLGGDYTQGAHGDLQAATRTAMAMVAAYGMTDSGLVVIGEDAMRLGGPVAEKVHAAVNDLLDEARTDARLLLNQNADALRALAERLLEDEDLTLEQVRETVSGLTSGEYVFTGDGSFTVTEADTQPTKTVTVGS